MGVDARDLSLHPDRVSNPTLIKLVRIAWSFDEREDVA